MDASHSSGGPNSDACHHISKVLFSSILSRQQDHLPLKVLNIRGFDFELASGLLVAAIAFQYLRTLVLQDCHNVSVLLDAASRSGGPDLNHLLITSRRRIETLHPAAFSNKAVESFLKAATGLQSLAIDATIDHALEPNIKSFATPRLERLLLRCSPPVGVYLELFQAGPVVRHRHWTLRELRDFIHRCPSLTELSINFPPLPISFDLEDGTLAEDHPEYFAFLVSVFTGPPHNSSC